MGHIWDDSTRAELRRLYVELHLRSSVIAQELGCTPHAVSKEVCKLGLYSLRPKAVAQAERQAIMEASRREALRLRSLRAAACAAIVKPAQPVAFLGAGKALPAHVRAAIDAAVAQGRVTVLPSGLAAGLSQVEGQFYAAPPPPRQDRQLAEARNRGGRKTALSGRR